MPLGLIILLVTAALIYFGVAHRVLDRMRLSDWEALVFVGLLIIGSFIDIPLMAAPVKLSINVGGAILPVVLAIYLLSRADDVKERVRAVVASVVTAAVIYGVSRVYDFGPEAPQTGFIDPIWLFGLIAGLVAYLAGRSRRAAFIAGTVGIVLTDIAHLITSLVQGLPATVAIGGAGVFDSIVLAGLIGVGLAEIVGETRERLGGGPVREQETMASSSIESDEVRGDDSD